VNEQQVKERGTALADEYIALAHGHRSKAWREVARAAEEMRGCTTEKDLMNCLDYAMRMAGRAMGMNKRIKP
jgi:hypothetical protein